MAKKDRDIRKEEDEQNRQQEEFLEKQERQNPTPVGGESPLPTPSTGRSPDSESQTSPHKLRDAPGTPVEGSPSGVERRGAVTRNIGATPPYSGPERRKS